MKGRGNISTVKGLESSNHMEETATYMMDPTETKRVKVASQGTVPEWCAHSYNAGGFACFQGTSVILEYLSQ